MFPANRRRYMGMGNMLSNIARDKKMKSAVDDAKRQAKNPNSPRNYKKRMKKPSTGRGVSY